MMDGTSPSPSSTSLSLTEKLKQRRGTQTKEQLENRENPKGQFTDEGFRLALLDVEREVALLPEARNELLRRLAMPSMAEVAKREAALAERIAAGDKEPEHKLPFKESKRYAKLPERKASGDA